MLILQKREHFRFWQYHLFRLFICLGVTLFQSYQEKSNLLKLLVNFSCFIRRTMEIKNINTLLHWPNAWHLQGSCFFPHMIILGYIFRLPLRLCSQGVEEVWLQASPHRLSPTDHQLEAQAKIWYHRQNLCSYQTPQELWKWSTYSTRPFGSIVAKQVLFYSLQIPESLLSSQREEDTAAKSSN